MIKAGMSAVEAIAQLTRGFIKIMGREPDGLEKIKIQQEAIQRLKDLEKVVDMQGRFLDPSKTIMGGTQEGAALRSGIMKATGAKPKKITDVEKAIDNASPGFAGDIKYDAQLVADDLAERKGKMFDDLSQEEQIDLYDQAYKGLSKQRFKNKPEPEDMAQGGRIGFKDGPNMGRRNFLKIMGGLAAIPIVGKFFKVAKAGKTVTKVPVIKTADVAGKPEWFDSLVNKVIAEGDDMTKQFATKDREIVHMKKIDDDNTVTVTQDLDEGAVRVEYDSPANTFEDTVQLRYKKPNPDEGDPRPSAEFDVAESGPVGRVDGPDDFSLDVDEVGGTSIKDLDSDVSKLKEYATGQKPTMKELVQNIKRKDKAKRITEDPEAQSDAVIRRQGDYDPSYDDYAAGGIARMLGE